MTKGLGCEYSSRPIGTLHHIVEVEVKEVHTFVMGSLTENSLQIKILMLTNEYKFNRIMVKVWSTISTTP